MELSPEEWTFILTDTSIGYHLEDYAAGTVTDHAKPPRTQPMLIIDARHIHLDVTIRLACRVPDILIHSLAATLGAMSAALEQEGANPDGNSEVPGFPGDPGPHPPPLR
jgi:hypothetical protein